MTQLAWVALALATCCAGFNDDLAMSKWSPESLYRSVYRPRADSVGETRSYYSRFDTPQSIYYSAARGPSSYRQTGIAGNQRFNGFFPTATKERRVDTSIDGKCMPDGEVCLFRAGFFGGMMKIPCCPGTTCEMAGRKFVCVTKTTQDQLTFVDDYDEEEE